MWAATTGHIQCLKVCKEAGANFDLQNRYCLLFETDQKIVIEHF